MNCFPLKPLLIAVCMLAATATMAADPAPVPYPEGYRQWTHVKSMVIEDGHPLFGAFGGIHHIYANAKAMQGYRSLDKGSASFPDGSVIVFDLLEARRGGGALEEGARKVVGVMVKDRKRWAATGGWGFEGFKGDSHSERAVGRDAATACFNCHAPERASDHVFSRYRR